MAQQLVHDCDGCGLTIPDGTPPTALLLTVYDRKTSKTETLEFAWDHTCGARAIEALRTEFAKPDLGTLNTKLAIPAPPTSTLFVPAPEPESPKMADPYHFYGPLKIFHMEPVAWATGSTLAATGSLQT